MERDANGNIQPDPDRFPSGMKVFSLPLLQVPTIDLFAALSSQLWPFLRPKGTRRLAAQRGSEVWPVHFHGRRDMQQGTPLQGGLHCPHNPALYRQHATTIFTPRRAADRTPSPARTATTRRMLPPLPTGQWTMYGDEPAEKGRLREGLKFRADLTNRRSTPTFRSRSTGAEATFLTPRCSTPSFRKL
jgi:hypothetical protein